MDKQRSSTPLMDLLDKREAEIEELKSVIEIMIQKAASKHRPAYDEQQECIMNMQTEIDELKKALESMTSKYSDLLIAKHRGEQ